MSNHKVKTQLPPEENIKKRGGVLQGKGYLSSQASGPFTIYANLGSAPSPAKLPDGTPVLVTSGANLAMYVSYSGAYSLVA